VTEVESTDNGKKKIDSVTVESTYTTFPQGLTVKGVLQPSMRRHGLYRVPVYEFDGTMSGHFEVSAPKLDGKVEYGVPYLAFRMSDARGIVGRPVAQLNGGQGRRRRLQAGPGAEWYAEAGDCSGGRYEPL
jgi:inner membrane protein